MITSADYPDGKSINSNFKFAGKGGGIRNNVAGSKMIDAQMYRTSINIKDYQNDSTNQDYMMKENPKTSTNKNKRKMVMDSLKSS